ncbi:hypothetical protein HYR99_28085 [Candidatus Poribacteria bacterium]|nr:hypothetical protein [Candidatus Poribacteria bacterium]
MAKRATTKEVTVNLKDLEMLIRQVVREEITHALKRSDTFSLEADSPLYEDMKEILARKERAELKFYTHEEVWGE